MHLADDFCTQLAQVYERLTLLLPLELELELGLVKLNELELKLVKGLVKLNEPNPSFKKLNEFELELKYQA